ncbi:MAG TPA: hypothetical protein VHC72_00440 [Bryobacteraceae bacterium]|nr:hypothetical protein [Bryobacteraceae bacterium]
MRFSSVSLGNKFTAVLLAAAAGYGAHIWLQRRAVETAATAQLSFSLHAARRLDAGYVHASEPAIVFANSVLSDQRIADLSKPSYLSTSAMMSRVGEFRSRLELTQPSPQVLGVRFRDADAAKAIATANQVANALVAWSPSPDAPGTLTEPTAPAQPAAQQPPVAKAAPAPAAVPAKKPVTATNNSEDSASAGPLVAALDQLQKQLTSTSHQVEEGGSSSRGHAYAQSEQQHLLKAQVLEAEKKVADLRAQYGNDGTGQHLGAIQQALGSVFSRGSVGVSASQLRREREGLTRAIAVVQTQRAAIEKEGGAGTEPSTKPAPASTGANDSNAQTAAGSGSSAISESDLTKAGTPAPASQTSTAAASQGAPGSSTASEPIEDPSLANPFRMEKAAGVAAPVQWWPAAAVGVGCGLLYLLLMAMISGGREDETVYAEDSVSFGRFITSDGPAPAIVPTPEPEPEPAAVADRGQNRRASFTWDPGPLGNAARAENTVAVEPAPASEAENAPAIQPNESRAVAESDESSSARGAFHQDKVTEKVVDVDPWADLMQKALSETDIGRKFETPKERNEAAKDAGSLQPSRSGRWAS